MRGQALKGHLDLLLLAVLSDGAKHGYSIIEELKTRSDDQFDLPEGTVYPALHRLEKAGLLESDWTEVNGRRRRTYRVTKRGRAALGEKREVWQEFSDAITSVLKEATWATSL
ncbi:MAG: helix-turn-helix transcriptional regulator [Acidimicrobiia bacterium]|jgi:transcriptional regulator